MWRGRQVRQGGNDSEANLERLSQQLRNGTMMFLKLLWNFKCIHLSTCQDMIISKDLHRLWHRTLMQNMQRTSDLADAAVASKCAAALTVVVIIPAWEWWAYGTSDTVQIIHTAIPREFSQRWKTTEKRKEKKRGAKQKKIDLKLPRKFNHFLILRLPMCIYKYKANGISLAMRQKLYNMM